MTFEHADLSPSEAFSPEGSHARTSPSLDSEPVSPALGLDSSGRSFGFLANCTRNGSCSKMCQGSYLSMEDGTWRPCSGRWQNSGMGSVGGFLTRNTSESRRDVVESSLSDILETPGPHLQKYFLSPVACQGILRRAAK